MALDHKQIHSIVDAVVAMNKVGKRINLPPKVKPKPAPRSSLPPNVVPLKRRDNIHARTGLPFGRPITAEALAAAREAAEAEYAAGTSDAVIDAGRDDSKA